ncbi:MAG: Ku protein [Alphaproteobacteria bacterium]
MPPHSTASASISFGLVNVPVRLYAATQSKNLAYRMLHAKDQQRVRQQWVCGGCNEVVERADMVRGYEHAKGQYVVLSDEELKSLETKSDGTIAIEEFVPIASIDPIHFETTQYLGADKGAGRAYQLLCEAMAKRGRCAVGRFSNRGRQQLVVLRQVDGVIVMHGLFYGDEVRDRAEIDHGDGTPAKEAELDLAMKLVDALAVDGFDASKYTDDYLEAGRALVEKKVAGQEIVIAAVPEQKGKVVDIMEALRASLGAAKRKEAPAADAPAAEKSASAPAGEDDGESESVQRKPPTRAAGGSGGAGAASRSRAK